jgi:AraC-like DNA-binding protein
LPVELREIGLLYYVSATSETLIEALQRTARYSSIVNEGVVMRCTDGDDLCMSFKYVGVSRHLDRHQMEFFVTALVRICRQLTGRQLSPVAAQLIHQRPALSPEFREFLGCDIKFGAATDEVRFPSAARNLPVVSADPYLNKLLITYCEEALTRRPSRVGSFRSDVESLLAQLLPHGKVRISELARRLGTSPRSFARRLSSEGVTYSEVLESLRRDLAERYLADETLTISQIAWLLGYQEVSAFTHAYKRSTGKSPRDKRLRS